MVVDDRIVGEIEDVFLMGSWDKALKKSSEILIERQLNKKKRDEEAYLMENNDERLLSVYLQSIFELGKSDELEKAFKIVSAFQPLPIKVAIQWSNFLIGMKQTDMASDVLTEYAEILRSELSTGDDDKLNDYTQVMDIMIFAVLLPQDLSEEMLLTKVQNDQYLDQPTKERFYKQIQSYYEGYQSKDNEPRNSSNRNSPYKDSQRINHTINHKQYSNYLYEEETSNILMIGGATLAVAVIAGGIIRYKGSIRGTILSITKSLKDVKDAFFEL